MRVSLPMYNLPEMRGANTAFWQAMRTELALRGLEDLPDAPEFDRAPVPGCIEPETLFSQVCGWPLQTIYAGEARLLGMPVYSAPHCEGPTHAGVLIVGAESRFATLEELRGCAFAFNSVHSNSGMNLPRRALAWSLAAFNVGVEIGQVCIVLAAAPLLYGLRRFVPTPVATRLLTGAAALVAAIGGYWFCQRALGL